MFLCLICVSCVKSADVTVAWDPSASVGVINYRLYKSTVSMSYTAIEYKDCGNITTYTWTGINKPGTYFFVVTARDADGNESDYSNEVSTLIKLDPASNFRIVKVVVSKNMDITPMQPTDTEAVKVAQDITHFNKGEHQ